MSHLYVLTLEVVPLEVSKVYDELPSHITLMSRFLSDLDARELGNGIRPLFEAASPLRLTFGATVELGPKRVTAHMISSRNEQRLHESTRVLLEKMEVVSQYPQFTGANHKPHVTQREGAVFPPHSRLVSSAAYLIEIIDGNRVVRERFRLGPAGKALQNVTGGLLQ